MTGAEPGPGATRPRLVLVDLDGTLVPAPSAEVRFMLSLLRRGRIGPVALARCVEFAIRHGSRFGAQVWKKNKAYLAGLPVRDVGEWAARFVQDELVPCLRPGLVERLGEHRRRGDALVLLTGTGEFIAAPLCRHLGIPDCVATRCAIREGRYEALPPLVHPFGREKLQLARELAVARGMALSAAWAYADSIHDAALLDAVGHAVAVHPDAALKRLALRKGWAVQPGAAAPLA